MSPKVPPRALGSLWGSLGYSGGVFGEAWGSFGEALGKRREALGSINEIDGCDQSTEDVIIVLSGFVILTDDLTAESNH